MAQTKGISLQNCLKFIRTNFGEENLKKVIENMEPSEQAILFAESKIKAMAWQPQALFNHLLQTLDTVLGQGDFAICEREGAFDAEQTFNGIFKVFIAAGNPHFIIRQGPLAWRTLSSSGDFEIMELHDHGTIARISNFDESHLAYCHNLKGFFKRTLEMSGGKNVTVNETKCRCHNDPYCEYTVKWE